MTFLRNIFDYNFNKIKKQFIHDRNVHATAQKGVSISGYINLAKEEKYCSFNKNVIMTYQMPIHKQLKLPQLNTQNF